MSRTRESDVVRELFTTTHEETVIKGVSRSLSVGEMVIIPLSITRSFPYLLLRLF